MLHQNHAQHKKRLGLVEVTQYEWTERNCGGCSGAISRRWRRSGRTQLRLRAAHDERAIERRGQIESRERLDRVGLDGMKYTRNVMSLIRECKLTYEYKFKSQTVRVFGIQWNLIQVCLNSAFCIQRTCRGIWRGLW